jgi:MoaA/NifB/PqqE/SkfB family radical SAM enzyme
MNIDKIGTGERADKYKGIELKAEITNVCTSGNCRFCSPMFRPATQEADTEHFLRRFSQNLDDYLSHGGRKIILTGGGEPLDAPAKLFGALREIRKQVKEKSIELDLLTIYSNGVNILKPAGKKVEGSIVDTEEENFTYLDILKRLGVTDINLSISGLTTEERTRITGDEMGSIDFDTVIPEIVRKGIRVMTRSTLTEGGIDDTEHVTKLTEWMAGLGVHIVYFSDLFNVPVRGPATTPGNQNVLKWTDEHRINLTDLIEDVKASESFEFVSESTRHSGQGTTWEFKHRRTGVKVLFGSLDIGNEPAGRDVYGYVKPDGSMSGTNNASMERDLIGVETLKKYRPKRDDWEK